MKSLKTILQVYENKERHSFTRPEGLGLQSTLSLEQHSRPLKVKQGWIDFSANRQHTGVYTTSSFTQRRPGWVSCGSGSYLNAVIVLRCKRIIAYTHALYNVCQRDGSLHSGSYAKHYIALIANLTKLLWSWRYGESGKTRISGFICCVIWA